MSKFHCYRINQKLSLISHMLPKKRLHKLLYQPHLLKRSALCSILLTTSFCATSAALPFVDIKPAREVVDVYGRVTGDRETVESAEQSLDTVDQYLQQSQEFYQNIARKNLPGILRQAESIFGQLGLPSPRKYPQGINVILSESGILEEVLTLPAQIYSQQQTVTDTANADQFWIYTDSVLGDGSQEGQSRLQALNQSSQANIEASRQGQIQSIDRSRQSVVSAGEALTAATKVEQLSSQAQASNVSQDVLKYQAAQQAELARSSSAISSQLSEISQQQALAAGQTAALADQSRVSNEHLTQIQLGQAIGNVQLHDIYNAQRHANQIEAMDRQKNTQLSLGATDAIYIPGLFSEQAQVELD